MIAARSGTLQRLLMSAAQALRHAASAPALDHIDEVLEAGGMHLVQLLGYNRALVAARDLPQGSLLLTERPLLCARAPQHAGKVYGPPHGLLTRRNLDYLAVDWLRNPSYQPFGCAYGRSAGVCRN